MNHTFDSTDTSKKDTLNVFFLDQESEADWFSWRMKRNWKAPYNFFIVSPSENKAGRYKSFKISASQLKILRDMFWCAEGNSTAKRRIMIGRATVKIYSDRFIIKGNAYGHSIKMSFMAKKPIVTVEFYNGYHSSIKSFHGFDEAGKKAGDYVESVMKRWFKSGMIKSWFTEDMKFFGPSEILNL